MTLLQPLLHDLTCTYAAPIQVWSEQSGLIIDSGINGIYLADTRLIREVSLNISADDVHHLSGEILSHRHTRATWVLRNADMATDPEVTLTIDRTVANPTGRPGSVTETYTITNASPEPFTTRIVVTILPDATSMDHIKAGQVEKVKIDVVNSTWASQTQEAHVEADGLTASGDGLTLAWEPHVQAHARARASWTVTLEDHDVVVTAPARPLAAGIRVDSDNPAKVMLERALSDLDGLLMSHAEHPDLRFSAAGAPWFFTLFGRDSLITARFILDADPTLAADTIKLLAQFQGTKVDPVTAEQPGKILHEVRRSGISPNPQAGLPSLPPIYYGTIDATPLWISLLRAVHDAGVMGEEVRELLPNLRAALTWMREFGDADGDGFLEYLDETHLGLANQGWKDSGDSVRWMDGSLAEGPIALCEVQGYAYQAALDGADLLEELDPAAGPEVASLRGWAANLKERFRREFWVETTDGRYPAIALDANKRPVNSLSSNIGHLLGTGILSADEASGIADLLVGPKMFSGLGIRTISTSNADYWPMRYHMGSVWPHDSAICIEGMLAEGLTGPARTVAAGLLDAARRFDYRLPELFGGAEIGPSASPLPYPASCRPQAWAAASAVIVAKALA